MIHLKIGSKNVDMASSWDDVTIDQFIRIKEKNNIISYLSILTDLEEQEIMNASVDDIEKKVIPLLDFVNDVPETEKMPDMITISDKKLSVPKDISLKTFGQKHFLQEAMATEYKKSKDLIGVIPTALAIYFYPDFYGDRFDIAKATEFTEICKKVKVREAIPVGNFFLTQSVNSMKEKINI